MTSRQRITYALIALVALVVLGGLWRSTTPADTDGRTTSGVASTPASTGPTGSTPTATSGADAGLPVKGLSQLPPEARTTWDLIVNKGPFPYDRDGVVFQNRERILPARPRGHYHEYTVRTPGENDRGARRLVTGAAAGELYYTDDHYRSFVTVDPRG